MIDIYTGKVLDILKGGFKDIKLKTPTLVNFDQNGLKLYPAKTAEGCIKLYMKGLTNTYIGYTKLNDSSSRSHQITSIVLKSRKSGAGDGQEARQTQSVLNIVDLASSEKKDKTGVTGTREEEEKANGASLLALRNVVDALAKKKPLVPYRASLLTQLLKGLITGNSKTVVLAAVGPSSEHRQETLRTIHLAKRISQLKTTPVLA